jgi:hypothetical protein
MTFFKRLNYNHLIIMHLLLIITCVLAVYWQVYTFDFLYGWDDQWFVTNYMTKGGFSTKNLYEILTTFYYGQYAPLNQYYYVLLYSFFEYKTAYYHVANVFVHLINSVLVYQLILRISTDLFNLKEKAVNAAFITALLFAVLPINVEPVAWVAASKVGIYALFYLSALINYIKYVKHASSKYFYLTILFYILSFGAKEQAVTLPVCMLFFDFLYKRNLRSGGVWLEKLPIFILSILFGLISMSSQKVGSGDFYSLWQRLPLAAYTVTEYATKCLIPVNLSYLYPFPFQKGQAVPVWMWLHLMAVPLVVYCFLEYIKQKWILFGIGFFVIHILLVSNVLSLARFAVVADRYGYLASIGLCFIVGYTVVQLNLFTKRKALVTVITTGYVFTLMIVSACYLPIWRNSHTLKAKLRHTIDHRQDYQPKTNKQNEEK